jgi:hypothetical protein
MAMTMRLVITSVVRIHGMFGSHMARRQGEERCAGAWSIILCPKDSCDG